MAGRCGFFFYPADWRSDPALAMCSEGARLLWLEMLLIMSESDQVGYLRIKGRTPTPKQIAALTRTDPEMVDERLQELEESGVFSRDKRGVIYSRKMVRDAKREASERLLTGSDWKNRRQDIMSRDGNVCAYCGDTDGPFTVDHIKPRSRGGKNSPRNLVVACKACNCSKGNRTVDEWIAKKHGGVWPVRRSIQ